MNDKLVILIYNKKVKKKKQNKYLQYYCLFE